MKNYVFKIFIFFCINSPTPPSLKYLKYQHQYKKNVIRFYDYFIIGGSLSGGALV